MNSNVLLQANRQAICVLVTYKWDFLDNITLQHPFFGFHIWLTINQFNSFTQRMVHLEQASTQISQCFRHYILLDFITTKLHHMILKLKGPKTKDYDYLMGLIFHILITQIQTFSSLSPLITMQQVNPLKQGLSISQKSPQINCVNISIFIYHFM